MTLSPTLTTAPAPVSTSSGAALPVVLFHVNAFRGLIAVGGRRGGSDKTFRSTRMRATDVLAAARRDEVGGLLGDHHGPAAVR